MIMSTRSNTQMRAARDGVVTDAMRIVAEREQLSPELVRSEVARGRLVIPANVHHLARSLVPMAVGKVAKVKINDLMLYNANSAGDVLRGFQLSVVALSVAKRYRVQGKVFCLGDG